jgi:hypothetical protein
VHPEALLQVGRGGRSLGQFAEDPEFDGAEQRFGRGESERDLHDRIGGRRMMTAYGG